MKRLETADLFKAARILKSSGLKEKIKPMLEAAAQKGADALNIGIDAVLAAVGTLAETGTEKALYDVFAGPFEKSPEEMAHLDIIELCDGIEWLWKEGNLQAFCERLSGLIGMK